MMHLFVLAAMVCKHQWKKYRCPICFMSMAYQKAAINKHLTTEAMPSNSLCISKIYWMLRYEYDWDSWTKPITKKLVYEFESQINRIQLVRSKTWHGQSTGCVLSLGRWAVSVREQNPLFCWKWNPEKASERVKSLSALFNRKKKQNQ